jgi:hypothetical protein
MDAKILAERGYEAVRRDAFRLAQAYCLEKFGTDEDKNSDFKWLLWQIEDTARMFWDAVKNFKSEQEYIENAERQRVLRTSRILERLSGPERILLREYFTKGPE